MVQRLHGTANLANACAVCGCCAATAMRWSPDQLLPPTPAPAGHQQWCGAGQLSHELTSSSKTDGPAVFTLGRTSRAQTEAGTHRLLRQHLQLLGWQELLLCHLHDGRVAANLSGADTNGRALIWLDRCVRPRCILSVCIGSLKLYCLG